MVSIPTLLPALWTNTSLDFLDWLSNFVVGVLMVRNAVVALKLLSWGLLAVVVVV